MKILPTTACRTLFRYGLQGLMSASLFLPLAVSGQVLTWDATPGTANIQNGSGTWNTTTANWMTAENANVVWTNSGNEYAQFGVIPPVAANAISIASSINLKGINFMALGTGTPIAGQQYTLNGAAAGTVLNFGEGGVIQLADYSSGGSQFVALGANLVLQGSNLTIQKSEGTVTQFINIVMTSNPNLKGNLTVGSYIYAGFSSVGALSALSSITILPNGTLALSAGSSELSVPIIASGFSHTYGAIRVTGNNLTLSGGITLEGDMSILMHSANTGLLIKAPIIDNGGGHGLHRFSLSKNNGTLTLTSANTYGGSTTLGSTTSTYAGGITILDFSAVNAPAQNILYNGLGTPGRLNLLGSNIGTTRLVLNGKTAAFNSQSFGDIAVSQARSEISLVSGAGGTMNLYLGNISRLGTGMIAFNAPVQGQIITSMSDAILGPWATFKSGTGVQSWAQVISGEITGFRGSTPYVSGVSPASSVTSHLTIEGNSFGDVVQTAPLAYLATVSMADGRIDRTLNVGSGNTLRLAVNGGVQITSDAKNLTLGTAGVASYLSAGGDAAGASQLILTNNSSSSILTIHSAITNNAGGGAVSLLVNGSADSTTVLTAPGTQTGGAIIASGSVEIRNGTALGTAGTINVLEDGALRFAGGITFSRPVTIAGVGTAGTLQEGKLRNVAGDNTLTGSVTLVGISNIFSDTGSLTIQAASVSSTAITGTFALGFGGQGDVAVNGRISIGTGTITKTGNGRLTLGGDNTYTGTTTISGGVIRVTHANALGNVSGSTTINANGALELSGGITLAAEPITLSSAGVANGGGIRNVGGDNIITGLTTISATTNIISSDAGRLIFDAPSGNSILHNSGSTRNLIFGGAGDIDFRDPIARTGAGAFTVQRDVGGTLNLQSTVANTITTVTGGTMHLDFSATTSPTANILHSGVAAPGLLNLSNGTIRITGKSGASNSQAFGQITHALGTSYLQVVQNGATRVDLSFGAISRSVAGVMGITRPSVGSMTTTGGTDNSIIVSALGTPFMWSLDPANGDEWLGTTGVTSGVRQIVPLTTLSSGGYTASTGSSLSGNANITSGVTLTTLEANTSITSLRFAQPQATTITQNATGRVLTVGGIMVSSTVGANEQIISTTTLKAPDNGANNDLPIIQNNTAAPLIITSTIINSASVGTALVKSGPGTLVFRNTNSFTGSLRVQEGIAHFQSGTFNGASEFLLGSGDKSGKIILGVGATAYNTQVDWIQSLGAGTDNRIVGGASVISILTVDNPTVNNNFRTGFLGGPGLNENNLSLVVNDVSTNTTSGTASVMLLPLGPANTYAGQTAIRNATVEVSMLANKGLASSLGTGNSAEIIEMGSTGASTVPHIIAGLRYVGSTDSTTNRPLEIANSVAAVLSITTVIENNGNGSLKFTSPFTSTGTNVTASRTLRLSGTHVGDNQIVGIGDNGAAATILDKSGAGTWTLTGASTYSGGTTVNGGTLLVSNLTGSATGSGAVNLISGTTLGGSGRIELAADRNVTVGGGNLQIGMNVPGLTPVAGSLTILTSGAGMLSFQANSFLQFDLFSGAGLGDNRSVAAAADLLVFQGIMELGANVTLQVSNPTGMNNWTVNDQWRLFDWTGLSTPVTGSISNFDLPALPNGLTWNTDDLFSSGILSISMIPEPSRAIFMIVGALAVFTRRRRGR